MTVARQNWAGNVRFSARAFHEPDGVPDLQRLVAGSDQIRAIGTGHSFSEVADTTGDLISLAAMPERIELDPDEQTVTVTAGTRWGDLGKLLQANGFALPNTGSLPHIAVAGAAATGTHGSGDGLGNLSTTVVAVELVTATGDLVALRRESEGERFDGMVLSLGLLGIVTSLTLGVMPTFQVRQRVFAELPHEAFVAHFDEVMAAGYSVSAFGGWGAPRTWDIWRKSVADEDDELTEPELFGAPAATQARHPTLGQPPEYATDQLGVPGPWNERLPHFKLDFRPSTGAEIQSEWMVARAEGAAALAALDDLAPEIGAVCQGGEIRTVAADDLWISPSYRRDSACLHFTWIRDEAAIAPVVAAIEERLEPFGARPHWGKRFLATPATHYPRLVDFRALVAEFDPDGTFGNDFTTRVLAL